VPDKVTVALKVAAEAGEAFISPQQRSTSPVVTAKVDLMRGYLTATSNLVNVAEASHVSLICATEGRSCSTRAPTSARCTGTDTQPQRSKLGGVND